MKEPTHQSLAGETALGRLLAGFPAMAYRCRHDAAWTLEVVSPGCEALTGHPSEDLVDNAKLTFTDLIHPDVCERHARGSGRC